MTLRDPIGVRFSELKDNWEEVDFINWDEYRQQPAEDRYRHHGDLPDGCHYGAVYSPPHEPWPARIDMEIVDETGRHKYWTAADVKTTYWDELYWPEVIVASPSGRSLVWLSEGELWAWHMEKDGFLSEDQESLAERLGNRRVQDAVMHKDGILEIMLEDGGVLGYYCDADSVLQPTEDGWVARGNETAWFMQKYKRFSLDPPAGFLPLSVTVMIDKEDLWGDYSGCGIRKVCFDPALERIEGEILADNPRIESVVIPDHIRYVDFGAFHNCTSLKNLVIEGDLSRVADWDKYAFNGCPCMPEYLRIRDGNYTAE